MAGSWNVASRGLPWVARFGRTALQLMKYTEGEADGKVSVRFCHYGNAGIFRRSPLICGGCSASAFGLGFRAGLQR